MMIRLDYNFLHHIPGELSATTELSTSAPILGGSGASPENSPEEAPKSAEIAVPEQAGNLAGWRHLVGILLGICILLGFELWYLVRN